MKTRVVERTAFWTKAKDDHLRAFYNDRVKVDPAIIALYAFDQYKLLWHNAVETWEEKFWLTSSIAPR